MSELRRGQKVRVTFDAEYADPTSSGATWVRWGAVDQRTVLVPPNATIEPIEDLRPGDAVLDAAGIWHLRSDDVEWPWYGFGFHNKYADIHVRRPFQLHIRDGQVIA